MFRQRTSQGLSQKEAAGRIGVDHGTLARWERGEREPSGEFLLRVNQFLRDAGESGERRGGRSLRDRMGASGRREIDDRPIIDPFRRRGLSPASRWAPPLSHQIGPSASA